MNLQPQFLVLAHPLSEKDLRRFRLDAGWPARSESAAMPSMPGQVRWAAIEYKKQRVGIARLELAPPQFCYVSELIIVREQRGNGLGEYFIKQIEQYCAGLGIARLLLQPVEQAQGFYDALHFIPDPHVTGFLKKEISPLRRKLFMH